MAVDGWGESEAKRQQGGDGWQMRKDRDLGVARETPWVAWSTWGAVRLSLQQSSEGHIYQPSGVTIHRETPRMGSPGLPCQCGDLMPPAITS